eukprot:TRINITY_DN8472_c0_g1_i1.p1 TRINITY_DN8472_c0_g1~~TRINITY_DN8472_c0_g1_i1.p1  ORF type:complete len:470 (-),score=131.32 TRINITY_DN8472_c0_g1_i1:50-1459(-)
MGNAHIRRSQSIPATNDPMNPGLRPLGSAKFESAKFESAEGGENTPREHSASAALDGAAKVSLLPDNLDYAPKPAVIALEEEISAANDLKTFCLKHSACQDIHFQRCVGYLDCRNCKEVEKEMERVRQQLMVACSCDVEGNPRDIEVHTWKSFFKKIDVIERVHLRLDEIKDPEKKVDFSVDLMKEVKGYLLLQRTIILREEFRDPAFVTKVMDKTSKFLELKSVFPDKVLVPSLDVMAVWSAILIRNDRYASYLSFAGVMIDHDELIVIAHSGNPMWSQRTNLEPAMQETQTLFKQRFEEDFPYEWSQIVSKLKTDDENDDFKGSSVLGAWNLQDVLSPEEVIKDLDWYKELETCVMNSCGCSPDNDEFLKRKLKDYEKWFYACSRLESEEAKRSAPIYYETAIERYLTVDTDLFWHVHLLFPKKYEQDCRRFVGRALIHNPWPKEIDVEASARGRQLFDEFLTNQGL